MDNNSQIFYVEAPRRGEKLRWIITFALIAILAVTLVFTIVRLEQQQIREVVSASYYAIGTLDEDGMFEKNTASIYTKGFIPVDGLEMEFVSDSKVTVQIFFYNKYNVLVDVTDPISATEDLPVEFPEDAVNVKFVLTPTNDAEVSWHEISDVASQFVVSYNK